MIARYRKTFISKSPLWDIKRVRCGSCERWLHDYKWEEVQDFEVLFCSDECELAYINSIEEDIVY